MAYEFILYTSTIFYFKMLNEVNLCNHFSFKLIYRSEFFLIDTYL